MDEHLQIVVKEIANLKSVKETSDREIADLKRTKVQLARNQDSIP